MVKLKCLVVVKYGGVDDSVQTQLPFVESSAEARNDNNIRRLDELSIPGQRVVIRLPRKQPKRTHVWRAGKDKNGKNKFFDIFE